MDAGQWSSGTRLTRHSAQYTPCTRLSWPTVVVCGTSVVDADANADANADADVGRMCRKDLLIFKDSFVSCFCHCCCCCCCCQLHSLGIWNEGHADSGAQGDTGGRTDSQTHLHVQPTPERIYGQPIRSRVPCPAIATLMPQIRELLLHPQAKDETLLRLSLSHSLSLSPFLCRSTACCSAIANLTCSVNF